MQVKSIKGHFINEFEKELSSVIYNHFKPDLAITFCSVSQHINELKYIFAKNKIDLVGATTAGEIYNHSVSEKSIVALLMKFDDPAYRIGFHKNVEGDLNQLGKKAAHENNNVFDDPSMVVFSGGLRADGEELVNGLVEGMVNPCNIYGALAGDDLQMENTYVFTNEQSTNNGIVTLTFDSNKIKATGIATSGWQSIGTEKTITKSRGNIVFTIDHQPALDVFLDYFNKPKESVQAKNLVISELAQYPLQVVRNPSYSVLRAPLLADEERGALVFSGTVPQGSQIKFSVPPGFETIENTTEEISKMVQTTPDADAILMFSCKARHQALGPLVEEEIEGIQNLWNAPLIGFFSYGEIGNIDEQDCDFHNETVSLVAIKEL
jgi:hypothetical protein